MACRHLWHRRFVLSCVEAAARIDTKGVINMPQWDATLRPMVGGKQDRCTSPMLAWEDAKNQDAASPAAHNMPVLCGSVDSLASWQGMLKTFAGLME